MTGRALSTVERGFAAAAARALGRDAVRLAAPLGEPLAQAIALLVEEPVRAREIQRLDASPPEGIERVHGSWWSRPPASTSAPARRWLERAATAHLVAMVAAAPGREGERDPERDPLGGLDLLPEGALAELVRGLGLLRVAQAFHSAPPGALAQLCMRLGEPHASRLLTAARAMQPGHDAVRSAQRSLFRVAAGDARVGGEELLFRAGARWLAPPLRARGGDRLRRAAQRLPRPLGRALLAEASAPTTPVEDEACEAEVRRLLAR